MSIITEYHATKEARRLASEKIARDLEKQGQFIRAAKHWLIAAACAKTKVDLEYYNSSHHACLKAARTNGRARI